MPEFWPRQTGNHATDEGLRYAYEAVYSLRDSLASLANKPPPQQLTASQVSQVASAISAGGSNPINVTGLPGNLSAPQNAIIPTVTVLPGSGSLGEAVIYNNSLWTWNGSNWQQLLSNTFIGTRAQRLSNFSASNYTDGVIFFETDTGILYVVQSAVWTLQQNTPLEGLHADRRAVGSCNTSGNNAAYVSGDQFSANWVGSKIWIQGAGLLPITAANNTALTLGSAVSTLSGASFVFMTAAWYSWLRILGSSFFESDTGLTYVTFNATGVCNTSGNGAASISGGGFVPQWADGNNTIIKINNNSFTIATVGDPGNLTVNGTIGSLSNATYTVVGGAWQYAGGIQRVPAANNLPTGLWWYDQKLLSFDEDLLHQYTWMDQNGNNPNGWDFGPGDDHLAGTITIVGPRKPYLGRNNNAWVPCDGNSYNVATGLGNFANVTTPNPGNNTFMRTGNYNGNVDPATPPNANIASLTTSVESANHTHNFTVTVPLGNLTTSNNGAAHTHTFTTNTGSESNPHNHGVASFGVASGTGTTVFVAANANTGFESNNHTHLAAGTTGNGNADHSHTLSGGNANVSGTTTDESATHNHTIGGNISIANLTVGNGAPASMAFALWMRR